MEGSLGSHRNHTELNGDIMPVSVTDTLDFPVDKVWAVISDFGGLMRWHPQVIGCTLKGEGVGCERVVQLPDRTATERLDLLDEQQHALEYTVTSAADPRTVGVRGRIELVPTGARQTRITWTSGHADTHPDAAVVNSRLAAYYPTRVEHLRTALAEGR